MTPKQRYKEKIKQRIRLSNEAEAKGLPADPWVVAYREKNNNNKAAWKAIQPKKDHVPKKANIGSFIKGQIPHNLLTEEQREESKKRWRQNTRDWHKKNRDRINAQRRKKRLTNPNFKIQCNLRKRLSFLLRKSIVSKTEQTMDLLGCSIQELVSHLSSQFKAGMSLENYGEWHIDHIIPCDLFDLTNEEERRACFHYTNLQPLWALDNLKKSNKIIF